MTEAASSSPYTVTGNYSGDSNYAPATASIGNTASVSTNGTAATGENQVVATATGGNNGVDTINEAEYGADPVGSLTNGKDFFDVAVSAGSTFTNVVLQDCNQITESDLLEWWDPTANAGAGGWAAVVGDPGPTYVAGPPPCLSVTLDGSTTPSIAELHGTVFGAAAGRAITSVGGATVRVGSRLSLVVTTTGSPHPSIKAKGKRPRGTRLVDHHNGTATLSGIATAGGIYRPLIVATYGKGKTKQTVSQTVTVFVFQAPVISSARTVKGNVGGPFRLRVKTKGFPTPVISESGSLPDGVTFTAHDDGTAVVSGSPSAGTAGRYQITVNAENVAGTKSQGITLVVKS